MRSEAIDATGIDGAYSGLPEVDFRFGRTRWLNLPDPVGREVKTDGTVAEGRACVPRHHARAHRYRIGYGRVPQRVPSRRGDGDSRVRVRLAYDGAVVGG